MYTSTTRETTKRITYTRCHAPHIKTSLITRCVLRTEDVGTYTREKDKKKNSKTRRLNIYILLKIKFRRVPTRVFDQSRSRLIRPNITRSPFRQFWRVHVSVEQKTVYRIFSICIYMYTRSVLRNNTTSFKRFHPIRTVF